MEIHNRINNNSDLKPVPNAIYTHKNKTAVTASTIGYCILTFSPQFLHFPLNVRKYDKTGILSYHFILLLQ